MQPGTTFATLFLEASNKSVTLREVFVLQIKLEVSCLEPDSESVALC